MFVILQTFLLKGYSRGTSSALSPLMYMKCTRGALGHSRQSRTQISEVLVHSKGTQTLGHSRHLNSWALKHLGNRVLEGNLSTQALGTRGTWKSIFSRLQTKLTMTSLQNIGGREEVKSTAIAILLISFWPLLAARFQGKLAIITE